MTFAKSTMPIYERRELTAIITACQKTIATPSFQQNADMQDSYKHIIEKANVAGRTGSFGKGLDAADEKMPVNLELVGGEIDSLYSALKNAYNDNRRETIYKDLGINLVKHIKGPHTLNKSQQRERPTIDLPEMNTSPDYEGLI